MTKKYRLLKSISSPNCNVSAGVIGEMNEESGRVYFDNFRFYYEKETVEKNPDWFSEIKEQEWEILECYNGDTKVTHGYISKEYVDKKGGQTCEKQQCKIYSVKRNSDNKVFSINDEIEMWFGWGRIREFKIDAGALKACIYQRDCYPINEINHYKQKTKEEQPFLWSDELVRDFVIYWSCKPHGSLEDFKKSKQQTNTIPSTSCSVDSKKAEEFSAGTTYTQSQPKTERPPLGVIPQWRHKEIRYGDLDSAIVRYGEVGKQIPQEWIDERHEIGMWLINRKKY